MSLFLYLETNAKEGDCVEASKISPRSKLIWRKCWSLDLEDGSQCGTNTQKSDDNLHFVEKLKNNSRNFKMMLRKCSSLDETMDETNVESDFENGIRRQGKGRNFISKIKRSSSSMFSSIEDELVKGKISLSDCVKVASKTFSFYVFRHHNFCLHFSFNFLFADFALMRLDLSHIN